MEESERIVIEVFPILGETATSAEPGYGAFDNPALGFNDEAFDAIASLDDVSRKARHDIGDTFLKDRAGISAVGKQPAKKRELPEQSGQQQNTAVAILHVGSSDQRAQQQADFVDEDMSLLAFDQLAGIEAMRIDLRPPFSALFTL